MNHNITKKIVAIGLASMMFSCILGNPVSQNTVFDSFEITASAVTARGTCGPYLKWSISGDTLTITGGGKMDDFSSSNAPWKLCFDDR